MKILIDTDWFSAIQDLKPSKQKEVLTAILNYPNGHSETNLWKKTILPNLEKGEIAYYNKLQNLKQNQQKSSKKNTGSVSESDIGSGIEPDADSTRREDKSINNNNNTSNLSTTRAKENQIENQTANQNEKRVHNALEIFGNSFRAVDAVVGVFDRPDGTTREGIQIKNPHLMAFVRQRFDKATLTKASDWAIDHNQRGHTYNASALIKLLCKFQTDIEPSINFNAVQAQYLTFEPAQRKEA